MIPSTLRTLGALGTTLLAAAPTLLAQAPEPGSTSAAVQRSFRGWNEAHGSRWRAYADRETGGYVQFLYGGSAEAAFRPVDAEGFFALARLAAEETEALHGVESGTLVEDSTKLLPLSRVGTTDKVTARFRQERGGVPVLGGWVNVLMTTEGDLLSIQTTAMPKLVGTSTDALVGDGRAATIALEHFAASTGLPGALLAPPSRAIGQLVTSAQSREARLVWVASVRWNPPDVVPVGYTYWIDAFSGAVIHEESDVHELAYDVGGTVSAMATPGTEPDLATNPEQPLPVPHARVNGGAAGTIYTDSDGGFNFPGVTGPINITVEFYGPYTNVDNESGAEYTLSTSVGGTGNSVLMNPSSDPLITAQANAHRAITAQRDWVRSVDPSDGMLDFRALANVNLNSTCNAYFDGSSVNMFKAGGGCVNTSYSTVVAHEMGHWHNVRYGTGNGSDGMGEGNADIWAMYLYDDPVVGRNFSGTGSIRTGLNLRQFCGDANPGCYGEVHVDGEPWMGAAWKVRRNLNDRLGDAAGDAVADALFIAWMNAYDQTTIRSVIELQWLTLDDDDGNFDNATPDYPEIDAGFQEQGFPGYYIELIHFDAVTDLPDTQDEDGPYAVAATITPLTAPSISSARLYYRSWAGWGSTPMAPTGGNGWSGELPGQGSPVVIEYYVEATDSLGRVARFPHDAPNGSELFSVGIRTPVFFDDFEGGTNGWTHGQLATQDDWQQGTPAGGSTDPSAAVSGSKVWGNDLGASGWNGEYQPNVSNWLRSPVIDCSGSTGTRLRLQRWLCVEDGYRDQARILVNGNQVFINPTNVDLLDDYWRQVDYDISAWADGNPSVVIELTLQSNSSTNYGGWNLDDVEVYSLESADGCINPVKYGTNKLNSLGWVAQITWAGRPRPTGDFHVVLNGAIPGQFALLFSGGAAVEVPFYGGFRLVGTPLVRESFQHLDNWGSCSVPYAVPAGAGGTRKYFQFWYRDPANPDGTSVGLSDGLEVLFCE